MGTEDTITVLHEKLGSITLQKDFENRFVYDKEFIKEVFIKGTDYLVSKALLSENDKSIVQSFISRMEFSIDKSEITKSEMNYSIIRATGEIVSASYSFFYASYKSVEEIVNKILSDLCQLIVLIKHPEDKLQELKIYGESNDITSHGANWIKYAEVLLPFEDISNYKIAYKAYDYMTNNLSEEQRKVFMEEYGENWLSILASDYADIRISDEYDEEDFSIETHLENHYYSCRPEFETENRDNSQPKKPRLYRVK